MATVQPFHYLLDLDHLKLSKNEILILEAELFTRIYEELREIMRKKNKDYFNVMKFNTEKENNMIEANFIRCIINDILSTEDYTLTGIAYYTDTPEEVIYDVVIGSNTCPSLSLARKVIELHRSVRPNLYKDMINKILTSPQELA